MNSLSGKLAKFLIRPTDISALVVVMILMFSLHGCGGDSGGGGVTTDNIIGPAGGTVTDIDGASVTIPAGALSLETGITVNTILKKGDLPLESEPFLFLLGGAEFGPEGTTFDLPVTITIPVEPPLAPGEKASVLWWNPDSSAWSEETGNITIAPGGASIMAEVTHFSIFSCVSDVFDDFHSNFGDGSTAESAFSSYVTWFRSNVTDIGRKGMYRDDCHEVVGLSIGLSYDVRHLPDGPHYQGIPYQQFGETTDIDVIFFTSYEMLIEGSLDKNYNLEAHVFLECCAPAVDVSADPGTINTNETSQVTATVMCDDEAMAGHDVSFESLGGLGTVSPSSAAVSAGGSATTTFRAGDDEGTGSVRASLTTCQGQESPDGAAQIEIGGDWTANMTIAFVHDIGDEPLFLFSDNVSISLNLSIEGGVVTGTGTGSHNISTSTAGNCETDGLYAPGFPVVAAGTVVGESLELQVVPTSMPLSFNVICHWDHSDDSTSPYPVYGMLESSIMGQSIFIQVPFENGGTDSGSGVDPWGTDIPMTYEYTFTLSGS